MQITDHVFVVSGAASGLGAATSRALVRAGARVVLGDVNATAVAALAAELGAAAHARRCDVGDAHDVAALVQAGVEAFGGVHGAVSCAGIVPAARLIGRDGVHPLECFERTLRVNLTGTFNLMRFAAAAMQRNRPNDDGERGVLINTASIAAWEGQIGQCAYAASKAGVAGMTLPIARELAGLGIRCLAIAPGVFATPMVGDMNEAVQRRLHSQLVFPPRPGHPEEFARLVLAMVENPMLNGVCIRLDGAQRMQA